jgi:hypothetical protein
MLLRKKTGVSFIATLVLAILIHGNAGAQTTGPAKPPLRGLVTMGGLGPLLVKGGHADNTLKEAKFIPTDQKQDAGIDARMCI